VGFKRFIVANTLNNVGFRFNYNGLTSISFPTIPAISDAPQNLQIKMTRVNPARAHLTWEAPTGVKVDLYRLVYWELGERWEDRNISEARFATPPLKEGALYEFRVAAVSGRRKGDFVTKFLMTRGAPQKVNVIAWTSYCSVILYWEPPQWAGSNMMYTYFIQYDLGNGTWGGGARSFPSNSTSVVIRNLKGSTDHYFSVIGIYPNYVYGPRSRDVLYRTPPECKEISNTFK
jgi:hypothetical protein